jgi:uncharacterized membrane protein YqjE
MVPSSEGSSVDTGMLGSLRGLADGLLATAQDRVELISLEIREEKFRLIQLFIWISAAVVAALLAITFVSFTIVYLFWDTARIAVLTGFSVLYTGGFVAALLYCRKFISRQPRPFESTLSELQRDRTCIRPPN